MAHKRLEQNTFKWPAIRNRHRGYRYIGGRN